MTIQVKFLGLAREEIWKCSMWCRQELFEMNPFREEGKHEVQ